MYLTVFRSFNLFYVSCCDLFIYHLRRGRPVFLLSIGSTWPTQVNWRFSISSSICVSIFISTLTSFLILSIEDRQQLLLMKSISVAVYEVIKVTLCTSLICCLFLWFYPRAEFLFNCCFTYIDSILNFVLAIMSASSLKLFHSLFPTISYYDLVIIIMIPALSYSSLFIVI